jgi:hypothetical protein
MRVRCELITRRGKIPYKVFRDGGKEHYNVRLSVLASAKQLASVRDVEYHLHPSFHDPIRVSSDRGSKFAVEIWTWGLFDVTVKVHMEDGEIVEFIDKVNYELPADDGSNYALI